MPILEEWKMNGRNNTARNARSRLFLRYFFTSFFRKASCACVRACLFVFPNILSDALWNSGWKTCIQIFDIYPQIHFVVLLTERHRPQKYFYSCTLTTLAKNLLFLFFFSLYSAKVNCNLATGVLSHPSVPVHPWAQFSRARVLHRSISSVWVFHLDIHRNFRACTLLRIRSATAIANVPAKVMDMWKATHIQFPHICFWQMPQCHTNTITQILRLLLLLLLLCFLVNRPLYWYCVYIPDTSVPRSDPYNRTETTAKM